ncbi:hypothetical protein F5051DRAFT_109812 [Lentinula edodes]|nr:hypothetical protein F5051DRAFT_109812 [Lentinula edodes]
MSGFSSPLFRVPRGHACVRCRQRKLKCSGTRPTCTECERANAEDECEYIGKTERSKTSILQDEIDRLQARVRDLEQAGHILLRQPYKETSRPSDHTSDLSKDISTQLIVTFMENANELCFFLNSARFRVWIEDPVQQHRAPPPAALMSVILLWGAHLSQNFTLRQLEEDLFARVLRETAGISSAHRPDNFLYNLQTEFLLARYLFSTGKIIEGRYHVSCALSIGVGSGINKIRSNQPPPPRYAAISLLPPVSDMIEEGERILCCWSGFTLDKSWAAALETSSDMLCPAEIPGAQTDTPWPHDEEVYEQGGNFLPEGYSFTTLNFIRGTPTSDLGDSTEATLAKAVFCWERACNLTKDSWSLSSEEYIEYIISYDQRRQCIARFISTLSYSEDIEGLIPPKALKRLKAHSMAHAANIEILRILPPLEQNEDGQTQTWSMISSAEEIMKLLASPLLRPIQYIDSVMGSVWKLAYQVLAEEIIRLKLETLHWEIISDLLETMKNGVTVIARLSKTCVFMRYQLHEIQKIIASVN